MKLSSEFKHVDVMIIGIGTYICMYYSFQHFQKMLITLGNCGKIEKLHFEGYTRLHFSIAFIYIYI